MRKSFYFLIVAVIGMIASTETKAQWILTENSQNMLPISLSYDINNTFMDYKFMKNDLGHVVDTLVKAGSGIQQSIGFSIYPSEFLPIGIVAGYGSQTFYLMDSVIRSNNRVDTIPNQLLHTNYDFGLSFRNRSGAMTYLFNLGYRYTEKILQNDASVLKTLQHGMFANGSLKYFSDDAENAWLFSANLNGGLSRPFSNHQTQVFDDVKLYSLDVAPEISYSYGVELSLYSLPLKSLYYGVAPEIGYSGEKNEYFARSFWSVGINIHSYTLKEKILSVGYAQINNGNHMVYCKVDVMPFVYHLIGR